MFMFITVALINISKQVFLRVFQCLETTQVPSNCKQILTKNACRLGLPVEHSSIHFSLRIFFASLIDFPLFRSLSWKSLISPSIFVTPSFDSKYKSPILAAFVLASPIVSVASFPATSNVVLTSFWTSAGPVFMHADTCKQ